MNFTNILLLALVILMFLSLIVGLFSWTSSSNLRKRFRKWKTVHATADLDKVYESTLAEVDALRQELAATNEKILRLKELLNTKVSTASVVRYNAFSDIGSDLSYSVALLDHHGDGVVLSSIYARDESRCYAKPVAEGTSTYPLTDEEKQAISQTLPHKGELEKRPR